MSALPTENLVLTLTLEVDGKKTEIQSGNIEEFNFNLQSYGHTCFVKFSSFGDESNLNQMFTDAKIMKASIAFKPEDPLEGTDPIFEVKGIVTDKGFKRLSAPQGFEIKSHRIYTIYFSDNAKVTWEQHFPINIYVEESMKDILEKHGNPEIVMKYDWPDLEIAHPITAFSLKYQHGLPKHQQTSFYSFLNWYLCQANGMLTYDYAKHDYTLSGKKKEPEGEPLILYDALLTLNDTCVFPPTCMFPRPARHNERAVVHTANVNAPEDKENPNTFKAVRKEAIHSKNYRVHPEQADEQIHSISSSEKNEIEVEIAQFGKDVYIDKLTPGSFVTFKGNGEGNWSRDPCYKDQKFRIRSVYFDAHKILPSQDSQDVIHTKAPFQLYSKLTLEAEDEKYIERPLFTAPVYPFFMQGTVYSDIGEPEQSTYKVLEEEVAPLGQYLVTVPLAGEVKKVPFPFTPYYSNQYYFPFPKGSEVMVAMYFRTGKIERPINWNSLVRLPGGVQANQIVFASNGKDKYTYMKHEFVDGVDSVFSIHQRSSETKTQALQIKEQDILINVDEEGQKTLSFHLNNDQGATLALNDQSAGTEMQIIFNRQEKSITTICKGSDGTSTILQKPDSISLDCKNMTVTSETVVFDAKDTITFQGKNAVNLKAKTVDIEASKIKQGG